LIPVVFACPTLEVNFAATKGWTALHFAAFAGNFPFIEKLNFGVCDVNAIDEDDVTPLHLAARAGHWQIVQYLIGLAGTDVAFRNRHGESAMHESICGNVETVGVLLDCPAVLPNDPEGTGFTPLHCAVIKQRLEIVQLLVDSERINVNCKDAKGRTPLQLAVRGPLEIVMYLAASYRIDVNHRDSKVCFVMKMFVLCEKNRNFCRRKKE
jgi:ankyrin repeat protein